MVGAEHDRVKRQESYVKAFRPKKLGSIALKKGPSILSLLATEITGNAAIEFRMLLLRRTENFK